MKYSKSCLPKGSLSISMLFIEIGLLFGEICIFQFQCDQIS